MWLDTEPGMGKAEGESVTSLEVKLSWHDPTLNSGTPRGVQEDPAAKLSSNHWRLDASNGWTTPRIAMSSASPGCGNMAMSGSVSD